VVALKWFKKDKKVKGKEGTLFWSVAIWR